MGKALEKVQAIQSELESQMDAAVGTQQDEAKPIPSLDTRNITTTAAPAVEHPAMSENGNSELTTVHMANSATDHPTNTGDKTQSKAKKTTRLAKKGSRAVPNSGDSSPLVPAENPVNGATAQPESVTTTGSVDHSAQHAAAITALEERHERAVSSLLNKVSALELQSGQYNRDTFAAARANWETESSSALAAAAEASRAEKADLLQEIKSINTTWEEKLSRLQEENDERTAALQSELQLAHLARAKSDDQDTAQQEEALRAHLAQKDEDIAAKAAELKQLRSLLQEQEEQSTQQIQALQVVVADRTADLKALTAENERLQSANLPGNSADGAREEATKRVEELSRALEASTAEVQAVQNQLTAKDGELSALLADLARLKETLSERERALETATRHLSEQHQLNEGYAQKIADLTAEIAEKDARSRATQGHAAEEEENRKLVARLQEQLKEQSGRLSAFEKEGQSLAKKQSEMEKVVRNSKKELRDKDAEIQKLKESKEQLVKAIEQTQDVLKKHESDANNATKTVSAMQAVSQASTEKIVRLETELTAKTEEFASQRRALEAAWAEANELKRAISELKADRDDLRKRIGEGTSKAMETESNRRDIEQREAVLRATSKQLQDSLQRQMTEAATREERLREEVNEMRKRWQEAVASRESMASELGSATAPLLRQISSLQESVRIKGEHWQNIESSLSERALRAENAAEIAEHKRALMEEQLLDVKQQLASCSGRLNDCQAQLSTAEALVERLRKREAHWSEEKAELDSKLALEVAQRQSLQSTLREIELRHKVEVQELHDASALVRSQADLELSMVQKDRDLLREELTAAKQSGGFAGGTPIKRPQSSAKLTLPRAIGQHGSYDRLTGDGNNSEISETGSSSYLSNGADHLATSSLPCKFHFVTSIMVYPCLFSAQLFLYSAGEATFAAAEKLQQRSRHRDDDMQALALQIQRLEVRYTCYTRACKFCCDTCGMLARPRATRCWRRSATSACATPSWRSSAPACPTCAPRWSSWASARRCCW
jgi:DNA repair exonuclease SbcCD ATPase subunit